MTSNVFGSDEDDVEADLQKSLAVTSSPDPDPAASSLVDQIGSSAAQQIAPRRNRRKRKESKDEVDVTADDHHQVHSPSGLLSYDQDVSEALQRTPTYDAAPQQDVTADVSKARKKRKKKKYHTRVESDIVGGFPIDSIQADIMHLKQNIVSAPDDSLQDQQHKRADNNDKRQVWHTSVQSQPVGKIFVERERGFKALEEWKLTKRLASSLVRMQSASGSGGLMLDSGHSALELGLSLHCYTKRLANYCHGILAGFALWQCVMVYQLTSPTFSSLDFVEHYSFMASLAQAFFYVLTAICLVSVMGRCDIGNYSGQWFREVRKFSAGVVALFAYFVTLLLSLLVADFDERLALHGHNSDNMTIDVEDSEIQMWKNFNLCRCLGAMTAWLALAVSPDRDLLYDSVRALTLDDTNQ